MSKTVFFFAKSHKDAASIPAIPEKFLRTNPLLFHVLQRSPYNLNNIIQRGISSAFFSMEPQGQRLQKLPGLLGRDRYIKSFGCIPFFQEYIGAFLVELDPATGQGPPVPVNQGNNLKQQGVYGQGFKV